MVTSTKASPFLSGNFAPVREEVQYEELHVIGELPAEMDGMYVRVGPNPQFNPIGKYHWFDGDGMLHGVRVKEGKASYRNRYVRTEGFEVERKEGKALWTGFKEPLNLNNPHGGPFKNAANTALVWHDGRLLSLWEGGDPHHIKVPGLETVGPYNYCGKLTSAFTAHPKVDAVSGEMMFFGYSPFPPYLHYSVVSADGELVRTVPVDLEVGVMMHDFAVTEHYSIFMDLPVTFRFERVQRGEPLMAWEPDRGSRFGIMPRRGANNDIKWFRGPPCFVFHTTNAHEEGDEVVLTACRMSSTNVLEAAEEPKSRNGDVYGGSGDIAKMHQWRFNLKTGAVRETELDDVGSDFPRVNDDLIGRKYRYSYSARFARGLDGGPQFDGLMKYDHENGKILSRSHGKDRFGGEGVFVPRENAKTEDEGWLVTYVYDNNTGSSEMLVVNADDFEGEPQARVLIPARVPYGFHGAWLSADQIANQRIE